MPPTTHSVLGASASHRWMQCPGSVRLSQLVPEPPTSPHEEEGTAAHDVAETALTRGIDASEVVCEYPDMAEPVQVYVDYVRSLPGELTVEAQFSLEKLNPPTEMWGTADAVTWDAPNRHLYVTDLKYGRGVVVEAEGNPQLRYYALGAVLKLGVRPDKITASIVQPRAHHPDGPIRTDEFGWDELVAFKQELMAAAARAAADDAPVAEEPGDYCKWCAAKPICPTQQSHALTVVQGAFTPATPPSALPAVETLDLDHLRFVLDKAKLVEDWFSSVRSYATERLERGEPVPGYKLVEGRASRSWADEAAAEEWLRQRFKVGEFTTRKLVSPYQVEKLLKERPRTDLPEDMIAVKRGVKLAPEDDPKPAIEPAVNAFDTLPNPNTEEPDE